MLWLIADRWNSEYQMHHSDDRGEKSGYEKKNKLNADEKQHIPTQYLASR